MENLTTKKCIPCEGGIPPLSDTGIAKLLPQVPKWSANLVDYRGVQINMLQRTITFKDFREAMAFLRKVEELAESEGHHPDFCVHYNRVEFTLWTHAIRGLHENDFVMAAKIDALLG